MATKNRVFSSFAIEDVALRDLLVGQSRNAGSPFSFTDMSVKKPWDSMWKTKCQTKIKGCDGVIGIITKNTAQASGQIWELNCAYEEGIPTLLMYGYFGVRPKDLPSSIRSRRILTWSWSNISAFLNNL
jgi:hypothetical protein